MAVKQRTDLVGAARPRTFAGLMALYESNYRRFTRLVPEIDLPFESAVSSSSTDRQLFLRVTERCRYTTTVHLTYWFGEGETAEPDPDLRIRLYRDAELAEAVHCQAHSRYAALPGLDLHNEAALDAQWPRNLLLNKWLAFCLSHGHGFSHVDRPRQRNNN